MGLELMLALLAGAAAEDPDYPLGRLRVPPIAADADPFRLVDLRYSFADDGGTLSSFETRVRVGGSFFVGGEVTGDRRGMFFDTQRVELGVSEENGDYEVEGSFRAPRFLVGTRALREDDEWALSSRASLRLTNDLELLFGHRQDYADFRPGENRSLSAGVFYQRESHFEALAEARLARVRREGLFENEVETYRIATLLNREPLEIDAEISYARTLGRLARDELAAAFGADVELGSHLLASASTLQRWEPGVLRFEEDYRLGLTLFGRRHRFLRRSEVADRLRALQRRASELGFNERRVYDGDGLRSLRERLGVSSARGELAPALDGLYLAQVSERNVPQLGFELGLGDDAVLGTESRTYRVFVGIPWRISFPWSRSEDAVEFVAADFTLREDDFSGGIRAVSRELAVTVFLNREMSLAFRWQSPGRTPDEIARRVSSPTRITLSYEYAMGR